MDAAEDRGIELRPAGPRRPPSNGGWRTSWRWYNRPTLVAPFPGSSG